jgi:hypothetical protein
MYPAGRAGSGELLINFATPAEVLRLLNKDEGCPLASTFVN